GAGAQARAGGDDIAIDVSAGLTMSCAARASGHVVCWGLDVLANHAEKTLPRARPFPVAGLDRIEQLTAGSDSLCTIDRDSRLRCYGTRWEGRSGEPYATFKLEGIAQLATSV